MMIALLVALGMNFFSYWFSDKLVLKMYNAQEVDETSAPQFYRMVQELAQRAELPMPRVYLIDEDAPNAFATGRNPSTPPWPPPPASCACSSERELRGVMAHELAHVKHRDILISTVSATMAGAISMLANFAMFFGGRDSEGRSANPIVGMLVMILAPLAASLIQMAISRAREFEADRGGAEISGDPQALASALQKIHALRARHPDGGRRAPPRDGADDDHEPAVRRRAAWPVLHPPGDRRARRSACWRWPGGRKRGRRAALKSPRRRADTAVSPLPGLTAMTRHLALLLLALAGRLRHARHRVGREAGGHARSRRQGHRWRLPPCRPGDRRLLRAEQEGRQGRGVRRLARHERLHAREQDRRRAAATCAGAAPSRRAEEAASRAAEKRPAKGSEAKAKDKPKARES